MYSYGPPHMAVQKQDDQHEHTFSNYVRIRDAVWKTCLRRWTIGKSGERGTGISVLPARHDDDDDDDIYAYVFCFCSCLHICVYKCIYFHKNPAYFNKTKCKYLDITYVCYLLLNVCIFPLFRGPMWTLFPKEEEIGRSNYNPIM